MWKYYKDINNQVYAYESDGSQDAFIKPGLIAITETEADSLRQPPPPTLEEKQDMIVNVVQARLDAFAQTRNYDNIFTATTYAASTNPQFALEGQYAVTARDLTWATCYEILNEFMAGNRPEPSLEQIMAELPVLQWPEA